MRKPAGLLLCALLLASLVLASPAYAYEKKVMGDTVVEEGETVEEISTAWGDIRVEGEVRGDVDSGFGDVEIDGSVGGDVDAGFGNVRVNGPVGGDVEAGFGDLNLEQGASVSGEVYVGHGTITEHPEARLQGSHILGMASGFDEEESPVETLFDVFGWVLVTLVLVGAAIFSVVAAPRPLRAATQSLESSPGRSFILGLGSVPAVFVIFILLAITGVGLLLIPLLVPAYLALLFFGLLVAAYSLGRKAVLALGRHRGGDALAATVGAVIVAVALLIPVLGVLVLIAFSLLGTGAAVSAFLSRRTTGAPRGTPRAAYASYEDYLRDRGG